MGLVVLVVNVGAVREVQRREWILLMLGAQCVCLDGCYLVEYKEKRKRTRSKVVWGVYYLMQLGDEVGQIKRHTRGGGISAVAKERCRQC